jgi:hypothetical protein
MILEVRTLTTPTELNLVSLASGIEILRKRPHESWADLTVHPSQLRTAMGIARDHNEAKPVVQVRVGCDSRVQMQAWVLRSKTVEVRSHE